MPGSTIGNIVRMLCGCYVVPLAYLELRGFMTNTVPINVYRGVGRLEDIYLLERMMDMAARQVGVDRVEIRRRNLVPKASMPYTTPLGSTYDCGDFERNLETALKHADWAGFARRREDSKRRGLLRGIGITCILEGSGGTAMEYAAAEARADGTVVIGTGAQSQGQGHQTTFAQVAAETLQIPFDQVVVIAGDTDRVADGVGTFASRSMIKAGGAAVDAIRALIVKGRERASERLETAVEDIAYANGRFLVAGTDRGVTLAELAADGPLAADVHHVNDLTAYPNGTHICEIEIDPETGAFALVSYVAVDDVGRAVNPMIVDGQTMGAVAQGLGQAMFEHCVYDPETGQLLTGSLMDYQLPRADEIPSFVCVLDDIPSPTNVLGVKGAGEAGTVAGPCASIGAVLDALAPLGVTHIDMPATPGRIWQAIRAARQ
jgi:carbon-monoxide dehydrogenase large subunit